MPSIARGRKGSLRRSWRRALAAVLITGGVFLAAAPSRPGGAVGGCPCRPCCPLLAGLPPLLRRLVGCRFSWCCGGSLMSGFVSVPGGRRVAGVVARPLAGGWVWARRALPGGAGWHPAPACLFVPFPSFALACPFARAAALLGWRAWVRSGSAGSPVFSACGLPVPVAAVKVALPFGLSVQGARALLASAPGLSSLGVLGV